MLITRPQMPEDHAWRIVDAILRSKKFKPFDYEKDLSIYLHLGALKALRGEPIPDE